MGDIFFSPRSTQYASPNTDGCQLTDGLGFEYSTFVSIVLIL
jgi:hypothetical protein